MYYDCETGTSSKKAKRLGWAGQREQVCAVGGRIVHALQQKAAAPQQVQPGQNVFGLFLQTGIKIRDDFTID